MAITQRKPTADEAEWYRKQGYNPDEITISEDDGSSQSGEVSNAGTIGTTLKAHAGSTIGGGAGALGAGALITSLGLAPETGGLSLLVPLIGAAAGAMGGSYLGGKAQKAIQGDESFNKAQEEAEIARQQHPITAAATDIASSALLSGGSFSPSTAARAGSALLGKIAGKEISKEAAADLANVAIQSAVNPAINTGLGLATGQGLPSVGDIAEQAIGGALFAKPSWLGRLGHRPVAEPSVETTKSEIVAPTKSDEVIPETANVPRSPFEMRDEAGAYQVGDAQLKKFWMDTMAKPITRLSSSMSESERYLAGIENAKNRTYNKQLSQMSIDEIRSKLTDDFIAKQSSLDTTEKAVEPAPEVTKATVPEVQVDTSSEKTVNQKAKEAVSDEDRERIAKWNKDLENKVWIEKSNRELAYKIASEIQEETGESGVIPFTDNTDELGSPINTNFQTEIMLKPYDTTTEGFPDIYKTTKTRSHYGPREDYDAVNARMKELMAKGEWHTPEFQQLWKKMEGVKNTNKGMPPADTIDSRLKSIANNKNSLYNELAKNIVPDSESAKVKIRTIQGDENLQRTHYDEDADVINLNPNATDRDVIHEIAHGATARKLPADWKFLRGQILKDKMDSYLEKGDNSAIKELINTYYDTAKSWNVTEDLFGYNNEGKTTEFRGLAGKPDQVVKVGIPYGMGNLHEFIAEALSNPEFQEKLNNTRSGTTTLWKRLVDAIRKLLGVDVKQGSMLERSLKPIDELIRQERPKEGGIEGEKHFADEKRFISENGLRQVLVTKQPENNTKWRATVFNQGEVDYHINRDTREEAIDAIKDSLARAGHNIHEIGWNESKHFAPSAKDVERTSSNRGILKGFGEGEKKDYIGDVTSQGAARASAVENSSRESHEKYGYTSGWRFKASSNSVYWDYKPSVEEKHSVENFLTKKGINSDNITHWDVWQPYNHYTPPAKEIERTSSSKGPLKFFGDTLSKIRDIQHPIANRLADSIQKTHEQETSYVGKFLNSVLTKGEGLTKSSDNNLVKAMRYELENNKPAPITMFRNQKELATFRQARASLSGIADEHIANKEPIITTDGTKRLMKKDDLHWPTTANNKVVDTIRKGEDIGAISDYRQKFIDYNTKLGMRPEDATKAFDEFKKAIQITGNKTQDVGNEQFYNAVRRMHSTYLPPEMTTPGFLANFERYVKRASADMAAYKHIESQHDIMSSLGATKDAWGTAIPENPDGIVSGHPAVKAALDDIKGHITASPEEGALSNIATAMFLGPGTNIHKIVSNVSKAITNYSSNPYEMAAVIRGMTTKFSEGLEHATENGILRLSARSAKDALDSQLTMAERMYAVANSIRKVSSLGDLVDKWNAGLMQAGFESLMPFKVSAANRGNKSAQQLMKRLDVDYVPGKTYDEKGMQQLASNLSGYIHGTGDARTLPPWMLKDSEISGFFKLAHWSVSQTSQFMHDIVGPAKNGNYMPLMNSLFGAAIGGYIIKELREKLQGKKGQIPSLSEIASSEKGLSGNIPLLGYELMASAAYGGFGGMATILGKIPLDKIYKNTSQGAAFPLDEVASDMIGQIGHLTTAIANDPSFNWTKATAEFWKHLMTTNFQLGRIAFNQAVNNGLISGTPAEKKILSDRLGELRRFKMASGLPYNEADTGDFNPYMNLEQKAFKSTQDIPKAIGMLPKMIGDIMEKYGDNPDVMLSKLKALKQNTYTTFPSIEETPLSFMKYLGYLQRKEGPEVAQQEMMDYFQHKILNEAKSSVVP